MVDISDDSVFQTEDGSVYRVNSDGSVTLLKGKLSSKTAEEEATDREFADLDYLLNNHPDRLDDIEAARARHAELAKEMGIDSHHSAGAFTKAKEKLRAKITHQKKSHSIADLIAKSKQNS